MTGLTPARIPDVMPKRGEGFAWPCLGYLALMLYSSTLIGPAGVNFIPADPVEIFDRFLATRFVATGSDQRADWIGNLLMVVPFGFLVAGTIPAPHRSFRLLAAVEAMLLCLTAILTIKYLQLFFPPRTVTLNYIVAQAAGASIGCAAFGAWNSHINGFADRPDPLVPLLLALRLYSGALAIFLLMPLDFALNASDLWTQAERLGGTVLALPGEGRPMALRLMVIAAGGAAFIPVGMLLVIVRTGVYRARRGLAAVAAIGLAITTGLFVLSTLVLGATPILVSILVRTGGIVAGAMILRGLFRLDPVRLRHILRGLVPWAILPYVLVLLLVNRLLSLRWLSPHEAIAQVNPLGLLPLFDYYIVSKAVAAKNIVGHLLLYMPIGAGLWLRDGRQRPGQAFLLAAILSFGVELARYLRPGLEGDINAIAVAGLSAALTMRLMPPAWSLIAALATDPEPAAARYRRSSDAKSVSNDPRAPRSSLKTIE